MPSRPLRRQLALALAGGTLALVAAVPPVAAATPAADATEPITARVMIGGACIGGDAPDGNVAVTLRRKGAPDLRKTTTASGGSFQVCFKRTVRAGDIVKLVADIKTRQVTVPRLDAFADRVNDTLTGHSAAGDLTGTFIDCGTGVCMALPVGPIGIKPDRTFSHPLELSGSDEVLLDLTLATGDVISTSARTATIVAPGRKRTTVQVLVAKSGTVVVTVRNAAGKVRGTATATLRADGRLHTLTIRKNGKAVALRPGDRIGATIAKDAKLTLLPSLKVAVDGTADTFDATCYPDLGYGIEFIGAGASLESGTADGSGKVHPIRTDFTTGDTVRVWCYTPAGDQVLLTGTVS